MRSRLFLAAAAGAAALLAAPAARAHVSVAGPAFAGERQVLAFHVGHGCAGADTVGLEIQLPAEVTAVRAMPSAFGDAVIATNDQGAPTSVTWAKNTQKDADDQYYEFHLRITVPEAPFSTLYFPAIQTCRDGDGVETTVAWAALPADLEEDPEAPPAPGLAILPARAPGWNKYTVPAAVEDLGHYFGDAQIVWAGDAAFSANPTTMELIAAEENVEELSAIAAGTEIWVKY